MKTNAPTTQSPSYWLDRLEATIPRVSQTRSKLRTERSLGPGVVEVTEQNAAQAAIDEGRPIVDHLFREIHTMDPPQARRFLTAVTRFYRTAQATTASAEERAAIDRYLAPVEEALRP